MTKGNQPHNDPLGIRVFQTKEGQCRVYIWNKLHVHKRNKSELPVNIDVKEEKGFKEQNHFKPVHNSLGFHKPNDGLESSPFSKIINLLHIETIPLTRKYFVAPKPNKILFIAVEFSKII